MVAKASFCLQPDRLVKVFEWTIMCDSFLPFLIFTAPEDFNLAFSRDDRGSSCLDDEASDAVIKILWFHM